MISRSMVSRVSIALLVAGVLAGGAAFAQDDRPKSPTGAAATQIGDSWIEVSYSRPILRGRTGIFGAGEEYGETVSAGAPLWRAGANVTTRFKTEHNLEINGARVPAGEYSLFVDLEEGGWTAVFSSQPYMESFSREKVGEGITWGAYGYSAEHDAVRAPMEMMSIDMSVDQLAIFFVDVTDSAGTLAIAWDTQMATVPFKVVD